MNIMLISPYFSPAVGGVETHLLDLCRYLESRGHTVFVRTYKALGAKNRGATNENSEHIKIHRLWYPDFGLVFKLENHTVLRIMYISLGLALDCLLFLMVKHKDVDVVQIHGFIAAIWGVPLAKLFRKRVVINTHVGFKFEKGGEVNRLLRVVLAGADEILVLTEGARKAVVDLGIPPSRVRVYHYWVNERLFTKIPNASAKVGWNNKFVVLFVGRLVEVKGVRTIFKLAKSLPNTTFAIAGSGPLAEVVTKEAEKTKNITFLGKVDQKNLPLYYSAADVLLIPSKIIHQTYEEGIPRVMIEALHCGLPVITTPSGGIPDVFSNQIGIMTSDSPEALWNAVSQLQENRNKLARTATNCRPFARRLFSLKNAQIIAQSLTS